MKVLTLLNIILFIWFTFSITGLRSIKKGLFKYQYNFMFIIILFIWLFLMVISIYSIYNNGYSSKVAITVITFLSAWLYLQYLMHWRYYFRTVDKAKVSEYYQLYGDYWRILDKKENKIIPDGYHIALQVLIGLNIMSNLYTLIT